jgi:hypothetical protein
MFVNIVNKHVLFYFILFGLLAQYEGETNNCDSQLSKRNPLKIMRAAMKRTRKEGREMQGETWKDCRRK